MKSDAANVKIFDKIFYLTNTFDMHDGYLRCSIVELVNINYKPTFNPLN